jgi:hypothetical protein
MATATKNYNAWDLSNGMDVDYSGSAERKKADEEYARAQKIIADAYEMDSYSATAQSNADKTNAENAAYLNTIDAKTNALNAENLLNTSINTDKQATLDAVNNFERFFSEEQRIPVTVSNQTSTEQNVVDTAVTNVNETATPQISTELPNNNENVNKQNNAQGATVQNTAVQSVATKNQQPPQQQLTRQRTNLEVLQAVELRSTGKVLYEVQKRIKQENINNAAGSAYYNPMASLDALRKAGVSVPIQLQNTGDGNYIQTLPDGKSINLTRLDVGVMVNDIIYSTRDMMKRDETAINDAKTQKAKQIEEKRKFENDLIAYDAQKKIDLSNQLIEIKVRNDYAMQQKAYEDSLSNKNTPTGQRTLPANMFGVVKSVSQPNGTPQPMSNMDFLAFKESGGDYKKMQTNGGGYVGRYQFGAASLVEAGLVSREKLAAANPTKKGFNQREFLENPANWINGNSLETFLNTPSMQDKAFTQKQAAETKQITNILKSRGDETYKDPEKVQALVNAAHLVGVGGIDKDGKPSGVMGVFKNGRFTGDAEDGNGTKASTYYADTLANIQLNNQLNNKKLFLPVGEPRPNNPNIATNNVSSKATIDLKIPSITKELDVLDLQLKRAGDALIVNKDRELKNELRKTIEELKSKRILLGKSLKNEQERIGYQIYKQSSDKQSKEYSQEYKNKKQELSNKVKAILEGK